MSRQSAKQSRNLTSEFQGTTLPCGVDSKIKERLDSLLQSFGVFFRFSHPRPFNQFCAQYFDGPVAGAEIGVHLGENAAEMFETVQNINTLHLVDPYVDQSTPSGWSDTDGYRRMTIAQERLKSYADSCEWHTTTSDDAAEDIGGPLDFVYIDGDHSYQQVLTDLQNYWPKVRPGGILGGHDLNMESVTQAVWEFSTEIDQPYLVLGGQTTPTIDFALHKPEVSA